MISSTLRLGLARRVLPSFQSNTRISARRFSSAHPPPLPQGPQPPNPHANIYKEFGRPFAKVFLMAFFTYQLAYHGWTWLEADEEQRERNEEIKKLEDEVLRLKPDAKFARGIAKDEEEK